MALVANKSSAFALFENVMPEFANRSLCAEVQVRMAVLLELRETVWDDIRSPEDGAMSLVAPVVLLCASLVAAFFGGRLFRPIAAMVAAVFAFYAIYALGQTFGVACETLLGAASTAGLVAALATGCVIKAALFLLGAGTTAAIVHLTYSMFPNLHTMGDQPTFAERSLGYWGLMALGGVGGGLILRWKTVPILEILTACTGGAGTAYALHAIALITNGSNGAPDRRIFFGCGILTAILGGIVQRRHRDRGCCKKRNSDS